MRKYNLGIVVLTTIIFALLTVASTAHAQVTLWLSLMDEANDLSELQKYDEAIDSALEALIVAQKTFGAKHPSVVENLQLLSKLYEKSGEKKLAAKYKEWANDISSENAKAQLAEVEQKFGSRNPRMAGPLMDLALTYQKEKRYKMSERLLFQAAKIIEDDKGKFDLELAAVYDQLGDLYKEMRQHSKATIYYVKCLSIRKTTLGETDELTIISMEKLGETFIERDNLDGAEYYYVEALRAKEKSVDPQSIDLVPLLTNVGLVYLYKGMPQQAEPFMIQALTIQEKKLGTTDPELIQTLILLASINIELDQANQAEAYLARAMQLIETDTDRDNLLLLEPLEQLATVYARKGNDQKAEETLQRILWINQKRLGPDHPKTVVASYNLGMFYMNTKKYDYAEALLIKVIENQEKLEAKEWLIQYAASLQALGEIELAKQNGDPAKAEGYYGKALTAFQQKYGENHPETALAMNDLATFYIAQGKYDQAEPLLLNALGIQERTLGEDHIDVATSCSNLGELNYYKERFDEAEKYYQRALSIRKAELGEQNEIVAMTLNDLGGLYHSMRYKTQAKLCFQEALRILDALYPQNHPLSNVVRGNLKTLDEDPEPFTK